jgi:hypothetical protein
LLGLEFNAEVRDSPRYLSGYNSNRPHAGNSPIYASALNLLDLYEVNLCEDDSVSHERVDKIMWRSCVTNHAASLTIPEGDDFLDDGYVADDEEYSPLPSVDFPFEDISDVKITRGEATDVYIENDSNEQTLPSSRVDVDITCGNQPDCKLCQHFIDYSRWRTRLPSAYHLLPFRIIDRERHSTGLEDLLITRLRYQISVISIWITLEVKPRTLGDLLKRRRNCKDSLSIILREEI